MPYFIDIFHWDEWDDYDTFEMYMNCVVLRDKEGDEFDT